jgi:uncharacterized protein
MFPVREVLTTLRRGKMANKHGDFIWYELMSPEGGASQDFYGPLLGWTFGSNDEYREIQGSEGGVGGILQLTPEMTSGGAHPAWVGYILVDDVDTSVAAITAKGGQVHMPARDMPDVGRFAMVTDPQGAPFYVMKPIPPADKPDMESHAFSYDRPRIGHCAWNELATSDPEAAKAFYGEQFGWKVDGGMDMGEMGRYDFWGPTDGRGMLGAVMPKMPQMPVSMWSFYFRVPDIDAAAAAIKANGGTMMMEPMEIPGGEFSLNAMDPQGAAFGLVGPRS